MTKKLIRKTVIEEFEADGTQDDGAEGDAQGRREDDDEHGAGDDGDVVQAPRGGTRAGVKPGQTTTRTRVRTGV
jgi:hypothetical protein